MVKHKRNILLEHSGPLTVDDKGDFIHIGCDGDFLVAIDKRDLRFLCETYADDLEQY